MKKLSIVLFSTLFIGLGLLYFLHFTGNGKDKKTEEQSEQSESTASGIAFVDIDSIIFKFDMFYDRRDEKKQRMN